MGLPRTPLGTASVFPSTLGRVEATSISHPWGVPPGLLPEALPDLSQMHEAHLQPTLSPHVLVPQWLVFPPKPE